MSTVVGRVVECRRFPVKSAQGLQVESLDFAENGAVGDRTYGFVDPETGKLLTAKRMSALLNLVADDDTLTLPDGTRLDLDTPGPVNAAVSAWLGRAVELRRAAESEGSEYEMTFDPPNDDADVFAIPTPAGSFRDLAGVHLLSTSALGWAAAAHPELDWDVRRFRPNLLVELDGLDPGSIDAPPEQSWDGSVSIGQAEFTVWGPTVRCAMPLRAQPGLDREAGITRALNEINPTYPNHLGIYLNVAVPGAVSVGDELVLG